MSRVLWISLNAAYDKVPHAGGKSENFYQKGLKKHIDDLRVLSFALESEKKNMDLDDYQIENDIKYYPDDGSRVLKMIDIYFYSMRAIKSYKKEGYEPDVIILQWTQMAFLIGYIKKYYPNAKYVIMEEDVAFLSYKRFAEFHKNIILKLAYKIFYLIVKFLELRSVRKSDLTICSNKKDAKLLLNEGISSEIVTNLIPYYQDSSKIDYLGDTNDIVFYGAMGRVENHKSALWFIEQVMPLIQHLDVRFTIVGGGVKDELRQYENERVKIAGYVEDVSPYFSSALCLAAPLVLGAGIKVKVLEAMSAGLPVITNEIGIEGIDAVDGQDFLYAQTPQEYAKSVEKLLNGHEYRMDMSASAKKFMAKEFNLEMNLNKFINLIESFT